MLSLNSRIQYFKSLSALDRKKRENNLMDDKNTLRLIFLGLGYKTFTKFFKFTKCMFSKIVT